MSQLIVDNPGIIKMRAGQRRLFRLVDDYRMIAFVARRQYGKTTCFGNIALKKMMQQKDHTVVFGSAKLNLSREIVRKEASVIERGITEAISRIKEGRLLVADANSGVIPDRLSHDDFAEMFEASRLEFRFYHSRNCYSRTKVVALRSDAVGETGDLMADEVGRINNWQEVWEAIEPIVSSNPSYRLLLSTTPPPDDTHYSFEQLCPPPGTEFPINPEGNIYESIKGTTCFRLDANDAYADGVPLFDLKSGRPLSPEEFRKNYPDKDACDRNYFCKFVTGGSAAIGFIQIMLAQQKGLDLGCVFCEDDLPANWQSLFKPGDIIGIGADPATTDGEKSNPFGITVTVRRDGLFVGKLILSFKSSDPRKPKSILRELVMHLHPLGLAIDASSEIFWATEVRQELQNICPVFLIKNGERTEYNGENVLYKTYLGNLGCDPFEDEICALPNSSVVKDDFRLVHRFKGGFDNQLDSATGRHGDLFDSWKLSLYALLYGTGATQAQAVAVGTMSAQPKSYPGRMPDSANDDDSESTKTTLLT